MPFKKILLPVDGSNPSMRAAENALALAKVTNAEIVLVHCHKPFPVVLGEPYFQKVITGIMDRSNQLLEPYRKLLLSGGVRFTERILEGPAGNVISEVAQIEKCDIVIMGSRGRTNLQGLLLGSVANRVLHSAPCPVLVIR